MPLNELALEELYRWQQIAPYVADGGWLFASAKLFVQMPGLGNYGEDESPTTSAPKGTQDNPAASIRKIHRMTKSSTADGAAGARLHGFNPLRRKLNLVVRRKVDLSL